MSCKKILEWLENSEYASIADMPESLSNHLKTCKPCTTLVNKLLQQISLPIPIELQSHKAVIKKNLLQKSVQPFTPAKSHLNSLIKLCWLPAIGIILISITLFFLNKEQTPPNQVFKPTSIAQISNMVGENFISTQRANEGKLITLNAEILPSDTIITGLNSELNLSLVAQQTKVKLTSQTQFTIGSQNTIGELLEGKAIFQVAKRATHKPAISLITPLAMIKVIGTEFAVQIKQGRMSLTVTEGLVVVETHKQKVRVEPGNGIITNQTGIIVKSKVSNNTQLNLGKMQAPISPSSATNKATEALTIDRNKTKGTLSNSPKKELKETEKERKNKHEQEMNEETLEGTETIDNPVGSGFRSFGVTGY